MNIYISGQGAFAVQVAESQLNEGHKIIGAAAPRLRKGQSDESNAMSWDRLRSWAYPRDIPWTDSAELRAIHIPDGVDIIVAAHSHAFLGRHTRARATVATIGY